MDNMFEKATRLKLRFDGPKGGKLTTEDLWDLTLIQLNDVAKDLNRKVKEVGEDDFLQEVSTANTKLQLQFNVVLHVLQTKKAEREKAKESAVRKEEREKIGEIIAKKQAAALENLPEEELLKKYQELSV